MLYRAIDLTLGIEALRHILQLSGELMAVTTQQHVQLDKSRKGPGGSLFVKSAKP